ncbi:ATP-dependent helicase HrpA [Steroidobacter denitrificans]|uniref:ATP-dependent helicase HrpA n=1 Tax=Steroidobacter denitrificans TaxID=465721 RepID=A0A127F9H8_STEDE|nr:ATP-dependent helicase HrpA [Steroidobacter denitrificans]
MRLQYDPALPITAHRDEIAQALHQHPLVVVCGATGSGKTTQLPKICLEAGRGSFGLIGHTQPRRIAARAIAARLANELGTNVGGAVGYQVRFTDRSGPDCRVKLMTDGILLRELKNDRLLRRYDTLIIDEAHERSLNIDFLLGVIKELLPRRPELRVIITSATIDPQRFAGFFGGAPVIEVSGRSYPVEVRYRPLSGDQDDLELSLSEGVIAAVQELDRRDRGDVLVFLPGEKQIREAADALDKAHLHHTEVLPLYARLSTRDQEKIFEKHGPRRIVLATNVAETSLTVPGIRHVIDSGLARISRYSVRGKVQRLPIEPVSQASADQRKGRAGRERAGICIRLYGEEDFEQRAAFTAPEVLRTNLASVILQMAALELGDPQSFPFLDPPDTRLINDGYRLLQELKAVDDARQVTRLGHQLATLPLDPRLGRMLISASHHGCLAQMLVIAAFLAVQDPRERPSDQQTQADQKHALFADPRSDFMMVLNLWTVFTEQSANLSGSQLRKWCREHFLSYLRLREWQDLRRQLEETVRELDLRPNDTPPRYDELHQAILTGFLGGIGVLDERREYEGARGTRFVIAPGTPLAAKPPKWVVAASLMETTRLYARSVAAVEPHWIESAGAHLLRRSYSEPHWVPERGFVAAYEAVALYGLTLAARRRINYGSVAPREAREIFVREALVEGRTRLRAPFLEHNHRLRRELEALEARVRRRDILVDEQTICDFYLRHLPEQVHSTAALEKWLKGGGRSRSVSSSHESEGDRARRLFMTRSDLMRRGTPEMTADSHPDTLSIAGNALPLLYRFEPGEADDGVSLSLPLPLLAATLPAHLAPIPGWREEAITALLRALPKPIRRYFVPVPEHAALAAGQIRAGADYHAVLADWINATVRAGGGAAALTAFAGEAGLSAAMLADLPIPDYLRMNVRVVDLDGGLLAQGRDLQVLKRRLREHEFESAALMNDPAETSPMAASCGHRSAAGKARQPVIGAHPAPISASAALAPAPRSIPAARRPEATHPAPVSPTAEQRYHRAWDFGELPASRILERQGLRYTVYPGLLDRGDGVVPAQFAHPIPAQQALRAGIIRLAILALPDQYKYARSRFQRERELALLGQGVNARQPLADALAWRVFADGLWESGSQGGAGTGMAILADLQQDALPRTSTDALPRNAAQFQSLLDRRRAGLAEVTERVLAQVLQVLRELRSIRQGLAQLSAPGYQELQRDVQLQLQQLMPEDFPRDVPELLWPHLARYMKALTRRIEKAAGNARRDAELLARAAPFAAACEQLEREARGVALRMELDRLQWMLQEFRVSLFAQDLRTAVPVSDKRLAAQLERARAQLRQESGAG